MQPTTLSVMLVGCRPGVAPSCDPAIDLDAPGAAQALSAYERSRTDAAREAVPLHPGARPTLFAVRVPLTPFQARVLDSGTTPVLRVHFAVQMAVHEYTDALGQTVAARDHGGFHHGDAKLATDEWVAHLEDEFGGDALAELAKIVTDRQSAGKRALSPFALPRGLMLGR